MANFANASLAKPCLSLTSQDKLDAHLTHFQLQGKDAGILLVGLYSDVVKDEEEVDEYCQGAADLRRARTDRAVRAVYLPLTRELRATYRQWLNYLPCALLFVDGSRVPTGSFSIAESHGSSLKEWALTASLPTVGQLTEYNFASFAATQLPMLLVFCKHTKKRKKKRSVDDYGFLNRMLERIAERFRGRLVVLRADASQHAARMLALGLKDSVLPAFAFNSNDGRRAVLDGILPMVENAAQVTLVRFVQDFFAGRLAEPASDSMPPSQALPPGPPPGFPPRAHSPHKKGNGTVFELDAQNFEHAAMGPATDVLLQLYSSHACARCKTFEPHYGKVALRFAELGYETICVARLDVSRFALPPSLGFINLDSLPIVLLLPARNKKPPWQIFTGKAAAYELMYFVARHANSKIALPPNPHLNRDEHQQWKVQIARLPSQRREIALARVQRDSGLSKEEL